MYIDKDELLFLVLTPVLHFCNFGKVDGYLRKKEFKLGN